MHYSLYLVFMIRDNGALYLVLKMTTHTLSSRCGILALLVLNQQLWSYKS